MLWVKAIRAGLRWDKFTKLGDFMVGLNSLSSDIPKCRYAYLGRHAYLGRGVAFRGVPFRPGLQRSAGSATNLGAGRSRPSRP